MWVVTEGLNSAETKPCNVQFKIKVFTYLALQSSFRIISDDIELIRTEKTGEVTTDMTAVTVLPIRVAEYEIINMLQ